MVGVRRNLVRVSWFFLEPFLGDVVPVRQFELPLCDTEPSRLLLHVTKEGEEERRSGDVKERDEERREGEEERRSGYVKERRRREGEEEKWGCEREGGEKRGRRGEYKSTVSGEKRYVYYYKISLNSTQETLTKLIAHGKNLLYVSLCAVWINKCTNAMNSLRYLPACQL